MTAPVFPSTDVTPPAAGVDHAAVPAATVNTWPDVPIASFAAVFAPVRITAAGDNTSLVTGTGAAVLPGIVADGSAHAVYSLTSAVLRVRFAPLPDVIARAAEPATTFRLTKEATVLDIGDTAKLDLDLKVDGVLTNPTTLTLVVQSPSQFLAGSSTTYTYPTTEVVHRLDPASSAPLVGKFRGLVDCTEAGLWHFRWVSTGTARGAEEGTFTVRTPGF